MSKPGYIITPIKFTGGSYYTA